MTKDFGENTGTERKFPSIMSTCLDIADCIETFPKSGFHLEDHE